MKISGQKDYLVSLESVAMTDIVLNMFIFFFISFSLLYTFSPHRIKNLEVELPKATSASTVKNTNQVDITITNEGPVYLNKELVTKNELEEKMNLMYKDNPSLIVILNVDKRVPFNNVAGVLDILSELGIHNLNIAARAEE